MKIQHLALRLLLTAFTFIAGITAFWCWTQTKAEEVNFERQLVITVTNENDSTLIYRAVLENINIQDDFAVISEKTFTERGRPDFIFQLKNTNLSMQPFDDYDRKSNTSITLHKDFLGSLNYSFLSEDEEKQIFINSEGWKKFSRKFPKAKNLFQFSRVGFNQAHTEAVVSVKNYNQLGETNGFTQYVCLVKIENKWMVLNKFNPKVSD